MHYTVIQLINLTHENNASNRTKASAEVVKSGTRLFFLPVHSAVFTLKLLFRSLRWI